MRQALFSTIRGNIHLKQPLLRQTPEAGPSHPQPCGFVAQAPHQPTVLYNVRVQSHEEKGLMSCIPIIIPAYNAEKTIKSCVDSVLAQDYDSYEIIIVDDGSKDATARILREEYGNNSDHYHTQ